MDMARQTAMRDVGMWRVIPILACLSLLNGRAAFAQTPAPTPTAFVDVAVMTDHDPTELFYGSESGWAGRAGVGVRRTERHGFRFEVDVPRRRVYATASSGPSYCAETAKCVGGVGFVPSRSASITAARTVSLVGLYGMDLAQSRRVTISLLAGAGLERREYRSSGWWDELDAAGAVVAHHEFSSENPKLWPGVVLGVDVEMSLTRHFAVTPQLRYHTFPYPSVSILRPGVAVRWRFR